MSTDRVTSRRRALQAAAGFVVAGGAAVGGEATARDGGRDSRRTRRRSLSFTDDRFYDSDGKFDVEKGKDAVLELCRFHRYPVFPDMREGLWVSDYGVGQFAKVGLAAYVFVNNEKDRYMMLDIFLLPHQMLPEHWHVESEENPAKLEGWLVRWGLSHIVGIGEPNLSSEVEVPECHNGGKVTAQHEVIATPGMFVPLAKVATPHWQYGGPQGAIITEVANVHTNRGVRHTDPAMNKYFLSH